LIAALGQDAPRVELPRPPDESRLPNQRKEAILKADYKKNLEDATELARLAEELKADLEDSNRYIVSVKTVKKAEDIQRLAMNIRGRLGRY
jgi:hypothetical protein